MPVDFSPLLHQLAPFAVLAIIITVLKNVLKPSRRPRRNRDRAAPRQRAARSHVRGVPTTVEHPSPDASRPTAWSVPALQLLEWKRFETVCAEFLNTIGFEAQVTRIGADGGIDIVMHRPGSATPAGIAQCKAWSARPVGVKPVRELYGVMAAAHVDHGVFLSTSTYTEEALAFADGKNLELVSGEQLIDFICQLNAESQSTLLNAAFGGDYLTPTCPQCDIKMTARVSARGTNCGSSFWGCPNFPRCKRTFQMRSGVQAVE